MLAQWPWPGEDAKLFLVLENNLPSHDALGMPVGVHTMRFVRLEDGSVALWQVGGRLTSGYSVMRSCEVVAEMEEPGFVVIHEIMGP